MRQLDTGSPGQPPSTYATISHMTGDQADTHVNPDADPWEGFGWDTRSQQKPNPKDTPPQKTSEGNWILYHATSRDAANRILTEQRLLPDDCNAVGVGPTPAAVRVYGIMKDGADAVVLKIVVDAQFVKTARIRHEWGGSGHDQWLFLAPHGTHPAEWEGIPAWAILRTSTT